MTERQRRDQWANWLKRQLAFSGNTKRQIAFGARIDPSYLTLMLRGFIPKRDKVVALAQSLYCDVDEALVYAGYSPDHVPFPQYLDFVQTYAALHGGEI